MVPCHETILKYVVARGAQCLYGTESAVVVGKHQSVAADDHSRAEVAEIHHGILQRGAALRVIEFLG